MWSHQLIGLLLILSLPTCLAAQALYKCRTPEGRLVGECQRVSDKQATLQ